MGENRKNFEKSQEDWGYLTMQMALLFYSRWLLNYLILIINFDFGAFKLFDKGNTKILAAVFGPREPKGSQKGSADADKCLIDVEYSRAAFSTPERKQRGRGDKRSQEIRQAIIFK